MPSKFTKKLINSIIKDIENGFLPAHVFHKHDIDRPYYTILDVITDKMNEKDPNHFDDVVGPLRSKFKKDQEKKMPDKDLNPAVKRTERNVHMVKNMLHKQGTLFSLEELQRIEACLQAALTDIALLKPTVKKTNG